MTIFDLENEKLHVQIKSHGAELSSISDKNTRKEYLWSGNPAYWMRQSPILFPFVGSLKNKEFNWQGKTYPMNQHGFARDMEFSLLSQEENKLWLRLCSNHETYAIYPFEFILDIGYALEDSTIKVLWKVHNPSGDLMHFSIGAHPGFICPVHPGELQTDCFIDFHTDKNISYNLIKEDGLVGIYDQVLPLENGILPIDAHLFDNDALINRVGGK